MDNGRDMTRTAISAASEPMPIGQVATTFGVTVRTLHHYDAIGLLVPSMRSGAGYRLYAPADVERLSRIVVYRRLQFSLEDIAHLLQTPGSAAGHLTRQRAVLLSRLDELQDLVAAIDHALDEQALDQHALAHHTTPEEEHTMTYQDLKALFGNGFDDDYATEAEQRWGDSPQWSQSRARTSSYARADWERVKAEMDSINHEFRRALQAGLPADSPEAMDAAEAHRRHIQSRFYDLDHEFHTQLGEMYVSDPRFTATYDAVAPGLAHYVRDAIDANAARHQE